MRLPLYCFVNKCIYLCVTVLCLYLKNKLIPNMTNWWEEGHFCVFCTQVHNSTNISVFNNDMQ